VRVLRDVLVQRVHELPAVGSPTSAASRDVEIAVPDDAGFGITILPL
jgi:hypothetical protein